MIKNKIIKYIKHIVGRSDSPPKQAIIYGKDEKKLWGNISQPVIDAKEMLNIFNANMKSIKSFSKY